jgi:hypothetical protein
MTSAWIYRKNKIFKLKFLMNFSGDDDSGKYRVYQGLSACSVGWWLVAGAGLF